MIFFFCVCSTLNYIALTTTKVEHKIFGEKPYQKL